MKTLKIFLAVLLFATISFAQDNYTSSYTGEQIDNGVRPYKVYTALLTQTGTEAPTAIVLENTLGSNITYSRSAGGVYIMTSSGLFIDGKSYCIGGNFWAEDEGSYANIYVRWLSVNQYEISVFVASQSNVVDQQLLNTPIEIRVYP